MNGGKLILTGLALLVLFLVHLTVWDGAGPLWTLITGGLAWLLIAVGVVFGLIGITDWRSQRAEAKAQAGGS